MNELAQPDTPLAATERRDFTRLDKVVHKGLAQFVEVGRALKEIRDRKLYRETFGTFEEYLKQRHELSRPRAYQLIDASGLIGEMSTIVDKAPANEGQCRELLKLPDGDRQSVWQEVIERADESGEAITAKMIREVAAPYLPEQADEGVDFDVDQAGHRLRHWLRSELDRWPEQQRHEAVHWITEIITKEFKQ